MKTKNTKEKIDYKNKNTKSKRKCKSNDCADTQNNKTLDNESKD